MSIGKSRTTGTISVCVVGSGMHFVSGISYYTYKLAEALSEVEDVKVIVILMRKLIPKRFYPGRDRVGSPISGFRTASVAETFDGVDWTGLPSVPLAMRFLRDNHPDVIVLQWWSGSVLPWYLALSWAGRRLGARIIIEFHEDIDTGEARLPGVGRIVRSGLDRLIASASAYVVHSDWDRQRLVRSLNLPNNLVSVIPHGPYPMARRDKDPDPFLQGSSILGGPLGASSSISNEDIAVRSKVITILFFGTIRPYKGLEYLVEAFELLPQDGSSTWRLLIVGETWEGWSLPLDLVSRSAYKQDIEVVNRYVVDQEVPEYFSRADIVALPYLRSSASGPLHMAMACGLPVVVSSVGGLVEAASEYRGACLVPAANASALVDGLLAARAMVGTDFEDLGSWEVTSELFQALFHELLDW